MKRSTNWGNLFAIGILGGIFLGLYIDAHSQPLVVINKAETSSPGEVKAMIQINYNWSEEQTKEEIRKVFFEDPETAVKIAKCESGLVIDQVGHTSPDFGLMQINAPSWDKTAKRLGYGDYKTNPRSNLAMARYLYEKAGKRYTDWVCYTHKMI